MSWKEDLISGILEMEWEMLSSLQAEGGGASCREDPETFRIIRAAGFLTWSETTLASYLNDLRLAKSRGRNLMVEKYARMEGLIPPLNPEAASLIDRIVRKECLWAEEYLAANPGERLARPIYSHDDAPGVISSETYSRAELDTYSTQTLEYYYMDILAMASRGENRIAMAVDHMRRLACGEVADWRELLASQGGRGGSVGYAPCS
ncbi:MAG: DUF4125 family protein [Actinobacteria bacterium]|nr:DUF4125 family protein [Actinomycetota bacterium]MDI6830851.1 DUF4125 family protein [Actinomycetota bacterium]